jgi:hypothetical protein
MRVQRTRGALTPYLKPGGCGAVLLSVQMSRMWDVAVKITGPPASDGRVTPTEVVLTVRPGLWTAKFLNGAGAQAGTALRQFGYLAQQTLRLDPYHQELAAKLAVYLTLMSRLRRVYQVQHLLEAVEPTTVLQAAAADFRRRYDLKRRWDEALLTLHEQRWQFLFDDLTYPVALRPDWALPADTPAHLRQLPVDYWRLLLAGTLTCLPPEPIPSLLGAVGEDVRPAARPQPPPVPLVLPPRLTGSEVRQARLAKGWSQQELLGRSGRTGQAHHTTSGTGHLPHPAGSGPGVAGGLREKNLPRDALPVPGEADVS